jgi:glycosyltransferase involved in cell wall biosynthesis
LNDWVGRGEGSRTSPQSGEDLRLKVKMKISFEDSNDNGLTCSDDFSILRCPYLLVTFIPLYQDEAGALWLERLWHHDLVKHLHYLKNIILCAPVLLKDGQADLVRFDPPGEGRFRMVQLPPQLSKLGALRALPRTVFALWRAIGEAEVVHSGVVGWPYPLGWVVNPLTILRRKALVIVVESSWLRGDTQRKDWRIRVLDAVSDRMARWSCQHADLAFYTQPTYRDSLQSGDQARAYVIPAVWINDADFLDEAAAQNTWNCKLSEPVRLLLAGRLIADKGIDVLIAALRLLDERGVRAEVDIIGAGERLEACVRAASELKVPRLSVLKPVPYGSSFFELVRRYHAVLIPNLTDEQPRILFDAAAQAVPAIVSDTAGLRPYVNHDRTGWLIPIGNSEALASAIEHAVHDKPALRRMGLEALSTTRGLSHAAMHRTRSRILTKHFALPSAEQAC